MSESAQPEEILTLVEAHDLRFVAIGDDAFCTQRKKAFIT